ncbi:MAG TPA: flagellum-specific ATP synthase FliI, partial [Methylovirgula sp.]
MNALAQLDQAVNFGMEELTGLRISGTVTEVTPSYYRLAGLSHFLKLGECVGINHCGSTQLAEVVRIDATGSTVKTFEAQVAAGLGDPAFRIGRLRVAPAPSWKGRVIDALGRPIDARGPLRRGEHALPIEAQPPAALQRARVKTPVKTGVRVIDLFMPICAGQRIGVFAGSGVGKSTLLGMIAGSKGFDTVVIALVGERGREVREFLDDSLGPNRDLAVTVVATGDESPM